MTSASVPLLTKIPLSMPFRPPENVPPSHRRTWDVLLFLICLSLGCTALEALAKPNARSTFPGRRVGGGTRGECTSRVIAHLVPNSSVFAPGADRTVALLEGPSLHPVPLSLEFRPAASTNPVSPFNRDLPASSAGITLLRLPQVAEPMVWTSSYRCDSQDSKDNSSSGDPLTFIEAAAPPALSLVVTDVTAADRRVQAALDTIRKDCGRTVPRDLVSNIFDLGDVITAGWPTALKVRCF